MSVLIDNEIKEDLRTNNQENSSSSKQQARVLEEESQRQEQLAELKQVLGATDLTSSSAQIISISSKSKSAIKTIADIQTSGDKDALSISSFIKLINNQTTENDLFFMLETAINSVTANVTRDKIMAKKQLKNLLEMMIVFERNLVKTQQNPELQNSLRQMQSKLVNLVKNGNIEQLQSFLKSPELKNTLQQGASIAAKQPENLQTLAENLRASQRESQKTNNLQLQNQQKPEPKPNLMEKMLNKFADKGRDILGINSKQPLQQTPNLSLKQNLTAVVVPLRDVSQNPTLGAKQPLEKPVEIKNITLADKSPISPTPTLKTAETKIAEVKSSAFSDKPPTSAAPKAVGSCGGNNCHCGDKIAEKSNNTVNRTLTTNPLADQKILSSKENAIEIQKSIGVSGGVGGVSGDVINSDLIKSKTDIGVSATNLAAFDDMMKGSPAVASR